MDARSMKDPSASPAPKDVSPLLLPTTVDRIAEVEPQAMWIAMPVAPVEGKYKYKIITYQQFANAINSVAWWLDKEMGKSSNIQPLAYFGTGGGDIGYPILLIAAVKAGFYTIFNSPRNSIDAHVHLFETQDCNTLILPDPQPPYVAALLEHKPMRVLRFPSLEMLLDSQAPNYPYKKSFEEARNDPLVSLHTSGSTGIPKPRLFPLSAANALANNHHRSYSDGSKATTEFYRHDFVLSAIPFFHAAALLFNICSVILARTRVALPPPGPPLNAETAIALMKAAGTNVAVLPTSTLDDIGKQAHLLEYLSSMKAVLAAGGSVSKAAGDLIITKTKLINTLGLTEVGTLKTGLTFGQARFRDEKLEGYQSTFELFPDLQEYSTHDLFCKHPTKSDHWIYNGRADDVIVFLNGEKTNPVSYEGLAQSRPDVRAALVTGQGHLEAALLIEPMDSCDSSASRKAEFIERLWPTLEEANRLCPAHARISKSHILFTKPDKPMSGAGKGTVQRRFTIENYSDELENLYAEADSMKDEDVLIEVNLYDLESSINGILAHTVGYKNLSSDADFFSIGMDSLQVIQTARYLKAGLKKAGMAADKVAASFIYTKPTISKLASAIGTLRQASQKAEESSEQTRMELMEAMMTKYSFFPGHDGQVTQHKNNPQKDGLIVLVLTGSTGALGSYLLETFLAIDSISRIYCLNRAPDPEQRQKTVNLSRGLTTNWDDERVTFLTSDFAKHDLGLGHDMYQEIVANADLVLHNAWQVDFNLSLTSYEGHIHGVHNLINLCFISAHRASIFFISSIGAVTNWSAQHAGLVPEQPFSDFTVPGAIGYSESKHVAERLLDIAKTRLNVKASICRVGQIAGPATGSKGMWNKQEWLPSLLLSSRHLGVLPESLATMNDIDWIPIDLLSTIIAKLGLHSASAPGMGIPVFHTVNPSIVNWDSLLPGIQKELGQDVKVVPFKTWLQALRASTREATTEESLDANPAVKLMDFYEGLLDDAHRIPKLETTETEMASPGLRAVGPVQSEWMMKWIRQWHGNGGVE